ncbi:MAG: hypothetical protein R2707_17245 [Acidimicrobiales bacterium]
MPVRQKHRVLAVVLAVLVSGVSWASPASGQSAPDPTAAPALTVASSATYRVDVEARRIEVEFGYEFENLTAATAFPGFFESVPVDAVDVVARDGSGELVAGATGDAEGFATWLVGFRTPLEPGDSLTMRLTWAIESGASLPGPIVEPAAVAFDVYAPGPEGASWSAPEVVVPEGFAAVSSAAPTQPYEIVRVEYLDAERFTSTVSVLPPDITISDWQDDGVWGAAVLDRAEAALGSLETWFGPRTRPFEVRRSFASDDHPDVSPNAVDLALNDAESIDHQLAHVWMADVPVDEAWFVEGLAAAFAGDQPNPAGPADIVPVVVAEIGAAGVRTILDDLRANAITYPGVVPEEQPLPPDWRTLLDHFERVAGAGGIDELFRSAVVDPADVSLLDQRAATRVDYNALVFRAGGWTLPPYLRLAMARWDFETFRAEQGPVSDVIVRRDGLLAWGESLELAPRDDAKAIFEAAQDDMSEVTALLDEQERALEAYDEAERLVNGDRGLLAAIGLLGNDVEADLASLRDAWAEGDYARVERDGHELAGLVEGAVGDGTIRLLVPAIGLLVVWQVLRLLRRRFLWRSGPAAGQP